MQTLLLGLTAFACTIIITTVVCSDDGNAANCSDPYIRPAEYYKYKLKAAGHSPTIVKTQYAVIADAKAGEQNLNRAGVKIKASLPEISRRTLRRHFGLDSQTEKQSLVQFIQAFDVPDNFKANNGLFVTLEKNGETRACWGSISAHHKNLVDATVYTTEDALHKDYRYAPISRSEINQLIPQITVVKRVVPINSISSMHPLKEGLMVRAGGKGAVLLPGEASDPHYQLVKCKLKAGIPSSQPCQMYKIEADVYR